MLPQVEAKLVTCFLKHSCLLQGLWIDFLPKYPPVPFTLMVNIAFQFGRF